MGAAGPRALRPGPRLRQLQDLRVQHAFADVERRLLHALAPRELRLRSGDRRGGEADSEHDREQDHRGGERDALLVSKDAPHRTFTWQVEEELKPPGSVTVTVNVCGPVPGAT